LQRISSRYRYRIVGTWDGSLASVIAISLYTSRDVFDGDSYCILISRARSTHAQLPKALLEVARVRVRKRARNINLREDLRATSNEVTREIGRTPILVSRERRRVAVHVQYGMLTAIRSASEASLFDAKLECVSDTFLHATKRTAIAIPVT